jgi:NAD(P)-dependent dehydrogenase (short-subunit alcohol dehydrogenase family)
MPNSIFITGGASGIGAAVARQVVAAGGYAGIIDVNLERARDLATELGDRAFAVEADVGSLDSLSEAYRSLTRELPVPQGLVNCAGKPPLPRRIEDQSIEEWESILDSHLKTTFVSCKVIGSAMAEQGRGAVVNIASVLSFRPGPVLDYGPGKAGIVNLTQSLAVHWAARGVRVNAVAPGWTDTPFLRPESRGKQRDFAPILAATPMRRLMQPVEIANVISFLLSDLASDFTGVTVPCDGGVIAGSGWGPYGGFPS